MNFSNALEALNAENQVNPHGYHNLMIEDDHTYETVSKAGTELRIMLLTSKR